MTVARLFAGLLLAALFAGCQTARPLYYWGHYEPQVYETYAKPGKSSVEQQIQKLKEDLAKGQGAHLAAHPGLHAHLGYLYAHIGQGDLARSEFETEKRLFPESAKFIDGLLTRAKPAATP